MPTRLSIADKFTLRPIDGAWSLYAPNLCPIREGRGGLSASVRLPPTKNDTVAPLMEAGRSFDAPRTTVINQPGCSRYPEIQTTDCPYFRGSPLFGPASWLRNFLNVSLVVRIPESQITKIGTLPRCSRFPQAPWEWSLGTKEITMKARLIMAAALVTAFAAPAIAEEFYVVQDTATKKCTIVDKKPTVATETVVSPSGTVYKTRAEAETGMKSVKVCSSN